LQVHADTRLPWVHDDTRVEKASTEQ